MLGIGIPGQSHTAKVNLGWFLLFTYASAYLYLGLTGDTAGFGLGFRILQIHAVIQKVTVTGWGVDPTYVQSPRHICLKN